MKKFSIFVLFLLSLSLFSTKIVAEPDDVTKLDISAMCGSHKEMVTLLIEEYDERSIIIGVTNNGMIFEIYKSTKKDTWTAVLTRPDGISCLLAAGSNLEIIMQELKKKGSKI